MNLDHAIERLYALKVDTTMRDGDGTPHEKPHKPLLLLAVRGWSVSLQAVPGASCSGFPNGLATPAHIPWCQELRDRFTARFEVVRKLNDRNNPDLPFRYLAGDDLWKKTTTGPWTATSSPRPPTTTGTSPPSSTPADPPARSSCSHSPGNPC